VPKGDCPETQGKDGQCVMAEFFKFPHTPHLLWLGDELPRSDKVLAPEEAAEFLSGEILVEEKVDGGSIGLSLDPQGNIRAQNRGTYLGHRSHHQFDPLWPWIDTHRIALRNGLAPDLILFGEWCYAQHSIHYDRLPDWFLAFDVYDRNVGEFWCVSRRNELVDSLGLERVPALTEGAFALPQLVGLLGESKLTSGPMEGIYLRREEGGRLIARAKIVRAEFTQNICEHWSKNTFRRNALRQATAMVSG